MRTIVKICGLQSRDAVLAADKADYAGFILGSPKSDRNIDLDTFFELKDYLINAKPVIVTVSTDIEFLNEISKIKDTIIQLHGRARFLNLSSGNIAIGLKYPEIGRFSKRTYEYLSIDNVEKDGYGGTGNTWKWKSIPSLNSPVLVAGGVSETNFKTAVNRTAANGIDVSSSVEKNGKKDPRLIDNLIYKVRNMCHDD